MSCLLLFPNHFFLPPAYQPGPNPTSWALLCLSDLVSCPFPSSHHPGRTNFSPVPRCYNRQNLKINYILKILLINYGLIPSVDGSEFQCYFVRIKSQEVPKGHTVGFPLKGLRSPSGNLACSWHSKWHIGSACLPLS